MEKVIAFLTKYAVLFNTFFIFFWLWILYDSLQQIQAENFTVAHLARLALPLVLLTLSFFNLGKALKARKRQD